MIKRSLESLLTERFAARKALIVLGPVSYTHLDVYKRQSLGKRHYVLENSKQSRLSSACYRCVFQENRRFQARRSSSYRNRRRCP